MNQKICYLIKTKIIIVLPIMLVINILVIIPTYLNEKWINMFFFTFGLLVLGVLLFKNYRKTKKISLIYLIGINIISGINFFGSYNIVFQMYILWFRAMIFLIAVVLGLVVVWIAKTKIVENFTPYLIISLLTVILNFAGLYESLYSMYSPYGQEGLKIEQDMTYSQAVMPIDFIYYSADAFFGTEISDVSIKYVDVSNFYQNNNVKSNHIDKYEGAIFVIRIIKMLSLLESILFIVYISIVVLGNEGTKREEKP